MLSMSPFPHPAGITSPLKSSLSFSTPDSAGISALQIDLRCKSLLFSRLQRPGYVVNTVSVVYHLEDLPPESTMLLRFRV
jgi:hypothetical protein